MAAVQKAGKTNSGRTYVKVGSQTAKLAHTPSVVCLEFQAGQQKLVLGIGSGATPTITLLAAAQNQQGQSICLQEKGGFLLRTDCFMGVQRQWPKLIWENRVSSEHPGRCVSAEEDSA